ncbi:hypothetical protein VTL71DRAFT_3092 [Oculimacula yallundae]|uniref:Uncharacterized protein n=1 Tax=Oculimacula yallundae TaxID=86028 RepID=A0ABR4C653_9HELO
MCRCEGCEDSGCYKPKYGAGHREFLLQVQGCDAMQCALIRSSHSTISLHRTVLHCTARHNRRQPRLICSEVAVPSINKQSRIFPTSLLY